MTYLYHRWEQVFGKDGLDLLLWIMILLTLHDSITSWAGAAKITTHQATTVILQVFSKEKFQRWQAWKKSFLALSLLSLLPRTLPLVLQGSKSWLCPLVSDYENSCTMTKVTLAHLSLSLGPRSSHWAGCFSWARPTVYWVWSSLYFIKAALGHSPVIARVFQMPGWKQTPIKTEWFCQVQKVK